MRGEQRMRVTHKLTALPFNENAYYWFSPASTTGAVVLVEPDSHNHVRCGLTFDCYRQIAVATLVGPWWLTTVLNCIHDLRVRDNPFAHTQTRMVGEFDRCPKIGRIKPVFRSALSNEIISGKEVGRKCC